MKRVYFIALMCMILVLVFGSCEGDSQEKPADTKNDANQTAERTRDAGVLVAKEILSTFDEAVKEVYELVKEKPEATSVKSSLEEVYKKYTFQMMELNNKYLDLKNRDIAIFGSANRYLGEFRGKHVWNMNQKLDEVRFHYQQQKDQEMDSLVHGKLIELLDKAVER